MKRVKIMSLRGVSAAVFFLSAVILLSACTQNQPANYKVPVRAGVIISPAEKSAASAANAANSAGTENRSEKNTDKNNAPNAANAALLYRRAPMAVPRADGAQIPAVKGLLADASRAQGRGDFELAAASLERAQRLAPQSAVVYQQLAELRLQQKRPAEAEQMACKALAFAAAAQQAPLWRQIAEARKQQGNASGAQEATARAAGLEGGEAAP